MTKKICQMLETMEVIVVTQMVELLELQQEMVAQMEHQTETMAQAQQPQQVELMFQTKIIHKQQ